MDRPVTILFLLKRVDCNDGVASYCETIIRGLTSRGDKVVIISGPVTEMYGSSTRRRAIEALVETWHLFDKFPSRPGDVGALRKMLSLIKSHAVDVISPQGLAALPLAAILSKFSGKPVVGNYHPSMTGNSAATIRTTLPLKARLLSFALMQITRPDKMIAMSKTNADFFKNICKLDESRIEYIPIGIETDHFIPAPAAERANLRAALGVADDTLLCVLSGRLNFVKGHDIVVDALRSLRRSHPGQKITCIFAGGGDQEQEIRDYALKDDLDAAQFQFRGFFSVDAIVSIYQASDIVLLPSRFEGFGLSVAEAMACGCVAIRTPSGGWQDQIIDGENGFIVSFNDSQALADRIAELTDSKKLKLMQEKAINFAQNNFSLENMIVKTSNTFRMLTQSVDS